MPSLIEVKGLKKAYKTASGGIFGKKGSFTAVNEIDLSIRKGEILGLIGESGSGKSTVGRLILRLIEPTAGSIFYEGREITHFNHKEMMPYYRKMQIIFQDSTSSFNPRKTIGEQIITPMLRLGAAATRSEAEENAQVLLEKVGLKREHMGRYPHEFSGGQRQRIGIARALALKPEFLVLDEPTSALDVSIQAQILNLLLDLQEEYGLTYLFIGHNLSIIEFFCDRVAVMYKGKLVEVADSTGLYREPYHPVSRMLLDSVLTLDQRALSDNVAEEQANEERNAAGCVFLRKCAYASEACSQSHPPLENVENGRQVACYSPVKDMEVMELVGEG
ncbi:ABC transporter ATP-binding protein [Ferviditalea candida]|uniref:ABC transporter ATP-binding protein n=1 Tax=Ferviditalea candida TaxID=3108399 RepID=A0ABU5ZHS0_9BACL|nr:ABC transporter ATP-binding protein [Paenibacillaceae bacterium T2]